MIKVDAAQGESGLVRTEGGLIVPADALPPKARQAWTWDAWKKIDRGFKELAERGGILAILACTKCGKRFQARPVDTRGNFELECSCTIHAVNRR